MNDKINKTQNLVQLIFKKWLILNERAELLRPALVDKELVQQYNNAGRARGFDLIRLSLAEHCIIQASALLKKFKDTDVSLENCIVDLKNINGKFYKELKEEFSKPQHIEWVDSGKIDPSILKLLQEQFEITDAKKKNELFDAVAKEVVLSYDHLMENGLGDKITNIRNKVIAHLGTRFENGARVPQSSENFELLVNDIFNIVNEIGEVAKQCALLICNSAWELDSIKQYHKEQAVEFWKGQGSFSGSRLESRRSEKIGI